VTPEVLILHGGTGEAQRYRCSHLVEQLRMAGVACCTHAYGRQVLAAVVAPAIVILHRVPWDGFLTRATNVLRAHGARVLFDTDDLIFDGSVLEYIQSYRKLPATDRALFRRDVRDCEACLRRADAVLVATEELAERVVSFGARAVVHRNGFSLEMSTLSERARSLATKNQHDSVVLGYASGTATHDADFAAITPALTGVLQRFPRVRIVVLGPLELDEWGERHADRISRRPLVPWRELPQHLAAFDVNLAPLESANPFCAAKSEVKYIEASLVATPTVASDLGGYRYAIKNGDNGFLARTEEAWGEALSSLVQSHHLRIEMGQRALGDVRTRYDPLRRSEEIVRKLGLGGLGLVSKRPATSAEAAARPLVGGGEAFACCTAARRQRSLLARALDVLRFRGPRVFLLQALVQARRLRAVRRTR
jgi:O-antigen biosynthesis protein